MLIKKVSKMIILTILILSFSFLFTSCGGDNPIKTEVTQGLNTVGGSYYKAVMGATNNIEFSLGAADKSPIVGSWVYFNLLLGDGTIVNDSAQTDSNGKAVCQYTFDGTLGHAEIQALVRNIDTTTVTVRANTLIPGTTGQGQYILMEDRYSDVKNFNGTPECVDPDPDNWFLYVVYESSLGVVVLVEDVNHDSVAVDTAQVLGVTVNTIYSGKTSESIGIGSTLGDVTDVYGAIGDELFESSGAIINCGDTILVDADWRYKLPYQGLTFYSDTNSEIGRASCRERV